MGALLVLGVALAGEPFFVANDDVTMQAFSNGDYTGAVAGRLVHVNAVAGKTLALLFSRFPSVPWYSLNLWGAWITTFSCALFLAVAGPARQRATRLALALCATGLAVPTAALQPTFTSAALALGAAGLLMLAAASTRRGVMAWTAAGIGVLACVAASMIRWDSFLGIVLGFLPVWFAVATRAGPRRSAVALATLFVAVGGFYLVDRSLYADGAWRDYDSFRQAHKALFRDNQLRPSEELRNTLRTVGWSTGDAALFKRFVYADPDVFTSDALRTLEDTLPRRRAAEPSQIFRTAVAPYSEFAVLLVAIVVVNMGRCRRALHRLWLAGSLVWFLAICGYLTMYVRFPTRMATPFWACAVVIAAVVPDALAGADGLRRAIVVSAPRARIATLSATTLVLVAVSANALHRATSIGDAAREERATLATDLETLRRVDPDGVFIGPGGSLPTRGADPWRSATPFREIAYVELGWPTFSPHFERRLASLGIDDLYEHLAFEPGFYFLGRETLVTRFQQSLRDHHGWEVTFDPLAELHDGYFVWTAVGSRRR